jgi:phosphohistidine phosphatase
MKKHLFLIRHAKSSWEDASLDDYHRPLNSRGQRDAPAMGDRLKQRGIIPDLLLTSPARRAKMTCELIARRLDYPLGAIEENEDMYMAEVSDLLSIINGLDDTWRTVFLFGHNPEFTDLANRLNGTEIDNVPTCGIIHCQFDVNSWADVTFGSGKEMFFDYPKKNA